MPGLSITHMGKAEQKVEQTEILANLGVIAAGIIGIIAGYFSKKPIKTAAPDAVLTTLGGEFGSRIQMDEMNQQLKRIADCLAILADRKQAEIEDKLDELLERVEDRR